MSEFRDVLVFYLIIYFYFLDSASAGIIYYCINYIFLSLVNLKEMVDWLSPSHMFPSDSHVLSVQTKLLR